MSCAVRRHRTPAGGRFAWQLSFRPLCWVGSYAAFGGKALATQRVWRILLNISRVRVQSAAGPHGWCRSPYPHAHRAAASGTGREGR